jgi:hypothetical protein
MVLALILNLLPIRRMLRFLKNLERKMQDQEPSEETRTPEEAEKLAREVMKRMLSTPPTPHVPKEKAAKKKLKSPRK